MPRYWWVNQNQTYKAEVGGGYMWSPKTNKDGGFSQFTFRQMMPPASAGVSFTNQCYKYTDAPDVKWILGRALGHESECRFRTAHDRAL
jgi:hypothetical protein